MQSKIKIALCGPCYGHNVYPVLALLNKMPTIEVTFFYKGKSEHKSTFANIDFVQANSIKCFSKLIHCKQYDIIWILGSTFFLLTIHLISIFRSRKQRVVFVPYGETILRKAVKKNTMGYLIKSALTKCDYVFFNWYGTVKNMLYKILKDYPSKIKWVPMYGLSEEYLSYSREAISQDAESVIIKNDFRNNKYKFFYPKTFSVASAHHLVAESAKLLKEEEFDNFIIYFWPGSECNIEVKKRLIAQIADLELSEFVKIIEQDTLLSISDFCHIYSLMDCGLQIAIFDVFSTTFYEPMMLKKDFIATAIEPYTAFEQVYKCNLDLVDLDVISIKEQMKKKLQGQVSSIEMKEKLYTIAQSDFIYEKNIAGLIEKILNDFEK